MPRGLMLAAWVVAAACGPAERDGGPGDAGPARTSDGADMGARDGAARPGSESDASTNPAPPVLIAGTGTTAFVPVSEGDPLEWVRGPQGGYHVFGGLSASPEVLERFDIETLDDVAHGYELEDAAGETLAEAWLLGLFGDWREQPGGRFASSGVLLVLMPGRSPHAVSREELTYRVFVESPDGQQIEQSVRVRTRCCR